MLLSAFFSGMEIAFVSSNRLLAEMDKEKNGLAQKCISTFYRNPNAFVSTMLVGNNIVLVLYGILFAKIFDTTLFAPFDQATRVLLDTVCSTIVVLFTGEFLPKTFSRAIPTDCSPFSPPWPTCSTSFCGPSAAFRRSSRAVCCAFLAFAWSKTLATARSPR